MAPFRRVAHRVRIFPQQPRSRAVREFSVPDQRAFARPQQPHSNLHCDGGRVQSIVRSPLTAAKCRVLFVTRVRSEAITGCATTTWPRGQAIRLSTTTRSPWMSADTTSVSSRNFISESSRLRLTEIQRSGGAFFERLFEMIPLRKSSPESIGVMLQRNSRNSGDQVEWSSRAVSRV